MHLPWERFRRFWLVQIAVFVLCFAVWFYLRTAAYLAGPPDGDLYAQTWSFQLMVGAFYLVGAIPVLATLFLVEAGIFSLVRRFSHRKVEPVHVQPQPTVPADPTPPLRYGAGSAEPRRWTA